VAYEVSPPFKLMIHCHCSRCRRSSGSAHATNLVADPSRFRWVVGEARVRRFDLPEAKSFGKWFCSVCGCPVPRLTRNGKLVVVPAGSLDEEPPITPSDHIFWSSRARWGCAHGGLATHPEYPQSWAS
jgi:hypothetical protein